MNDQIRVGCYECGLEYVFKESYELLCGKQLGYGVHREVFECRIRPDLVVKVEKAYMRYFANIFEMSFWSDMQSNKSVSKWLAPCEYMSPDGRILLQRRCEPVPSTFKLPNKIPEFLCDLKPENFGILDGRLVCVDYAITMNNPSTKLKKANWRI